MACCILGGIIVSFLSGGGIVVRGCERGDGAGLVDVLYSVIVLYVVVRPGIIRSDNRRIKV